MEIRFEIIAGVECLIIDTDNDSDILVLQQFSHINCTLSGELKLNDHVSTPRIILQRSKP